MSQLNKESYDFKATILQAFDFDILGICETFLRNSKTLSLTGYQWFGNNRKTLHHNAKRGSGGVGIFVKNLILEEYLVATDCSMEDVIWLKLKHRVSDDKLNICICYIPPDRSSRKCDAEAFFTDLMTKVYEYQNEGDIIICGDFNARCGDESDYIEGVDNVPPREVIDHKLNSYGQLLIDFLVD